MCWREGDRHNQDPLSMGLLLLFVVYVYVYECFSCRVSCQHSHPLILCALLLSHDLIIHTCSHKTLISLYVSVAARL